MTPATARDSVEENAHLIRESYAAFARGDVKAVLATLSADFEMTTPSVPGLRSGGFRQGTEGFLDFMELVSRDLIMKSFEPIDIIAQGDRVVGIVNYSAVLSATGRPVELHLVHVFTVANGKIAKMREYYETHLVTEALE